MAEYSIDFADRARISYDRLSSPLQRRIDHLIDRMRLSGLRSLRTKKIPDYPDMYVLRATQDIRVILAKEEHAITVLDIVTRDKLFGFGRF